MQHKLLVPWEYQNLALIRFFIVTIFLQFG